MGTNLFSTLRIEGALSKPKAKQTQNQNKTQLQLLVIADVNIIEDYLI
jgi:hypothetical protein